jgi:hypothetical protein
MKDERPRVLKATAMMRPLVYEGTLGEFCDRFVAESEGKPLDLVATAVWHLCGQVVHKALALGDQLRTEQAALTPTPKGDLCERLAAIEECAKVADDAATNRFGPTTRRAVSTEIAKAIRSLLPTPPEQPVDGEG